MKARLFHVAPPNAEVFRTGLTAVVSVLIPEPNYQGATKACLNNPEVESIVANLVNTHLARYLADNAVLGTQILSRMMQSSPATPAREAFWK